MKKKLYRSRKNAIFGGVIAGIVEYFGWTLDISLIRLLFVIIMLFTNGVFIVAYFIAWLIIPIQPHRRFNDDDRYYG
jgi:phage shock protein PspC (stress-responsive transcriptional regulator)